MYRWNTITNQLFSYSSKLLFLITQRVAEVESQCFLCCYSVVTCNYFGLFKLYVFRQWPVPLVMYTRYHGFLLRKIYLFIQYSNDLVPTSKQIYVINTDKLVVMILGILIHFVGNAVEKVNKNIQIYRVVNIGHILRLNI